MTAAQRESRPDVAASGPARNENEHQHDNSHKDGKARLSGSGVSRLLSIWLDQVYDDKDLPASAFKLAYRYAKRCRATAAKTGELYSFEGKDRLAAAMGVSIRQVLNLQDRLFERGHIRVDQLGKKQTNRVYPIIGDRKSSSDHVADDDRKLSSDQNVHVTGNPVPSDRKSSSQVTGNELPIHSKGVELRGIEEGGAPLARPLHHTNQSDFFTNTESNGVIRVDEARVERALHDKYVVGDVVSIPLRGECTVVKIGIDSITDSRFLAASPRYDRSQLFIIPLNDDGTADVRNAWPESDDERLVDEISWSEDAFPVPARPRRNRNAV